MKNLAKISTRARTRIPTPELSKEPSKHKKSKLKMH